MSSDDLIETNKGLAGEIKRLEGLVEARDREIGRLTDEWNACLAEVERLKPIGHTATCACQLCLRAYGAVESRDAEIGKLRAILGQLIDQWDPQGVRSSPDTKDPWRQAWWDARVALARKVP